MLFDFFVLCFFRCQKLSGIVGLKKIGTVVAIQRARVGWVEDGVLALFDEVGYAEQEC